MELNKTQKKNIQNFVNQAKQAGFLNWVKKLIKEFPKAKIYLVGGAVRDALLQIETRDYDFVITGVPIKKLEKFLNPLGHVDWLNLVGRDFGIFKFTPKGFKGKIEPLDIGLPRTEHSGQNLGIYTDFKVKSDHKLPVEEDLKRRDFTINAMAIDLTSDELVIIDKFNGLEDLKNKIIRTVGKPKDRFQEDYSRMLRAIRFACQLDFELDDETKKNIKRFIKNLNNKKDKSLIIPREILAEQFIKALLANPLRAFDLFDELKVFDILIPEIKAMKGCKQPINYHSEGDVWQHTRLCMEILDSNLYKNQFKKPITINEEQKLYNSEVVLATLLHDIDKPTCSIWIEKKGKKRLQFYNHDVEGGKTAEDICQRLKLSAPNKVGVDCKNVNWLIARHMLLIEGKIDKMRQTKVEKYLMSDRYPGENLLKLSYVDAISTIPEKRKIPKKKPDLKNWISLKGFDIALKRIKDIQKLSKDKKPVPKRLIDGNQVIKTLKIKSGKKVGTILDKVREEQLNKKIQTKKQAIEYIKKRFK